MKDIDNHTVRIKTQIPRVENNASPTIRIENGKQKEAGHYIIGSFEVLLDLQDKWRMRLNSIPVNVKNLMGGLEHLIQKLNRVSSEKEILKSVFSKGEKSAASFDKIMDTLNGSDGWDESKELRNIMTRVCDKQKSYVAKTMLLAYWEEVEKIIGKFFKHQEKENNKHWQLSCSIW